MKTSTGAWACTALSVALVCLGSESHADIHSGGIERQVSDIHSGGFQRQLSDIHSGGFTERDTADIHSGGFRKLSSQECVSLADIHSGGFTNRETLDIHSGGRAESYVSDIHSGGIRAVDKRTADIHSGGFTDRQTADIHSGGFTDRQTADIHSGGFTDRQTADIHSGGFTMDIHSGGFTTDIHSGGFTTDIHSGGTSVASIAPGCGSYDGSLDSHVLSGPVTSVDIGSGTFEALGQVVSAHSIVLSELQSGDYVTVYGSVMGPGHLYGTKVIREYNGYVEGTSMVFLAGIPSSMDQSRGRVVIGNMSVDYTAALHSGQQPGEGIVKFRGIQPIAGQMISDRYK